MVTEENPTIGGAWTIGEEQKGQPLVSSSNQHARTGFPRRPCC
jgi:hypothetical protein